MCGQLYHWYRSAVTPVNSTADRYLALFSAVYMRTGGHAIYVLLTSFILSLFCWKNFCNAFAKLFTICVSLVSGDSRRRVNGICIGIQLGIGVCNQSHLNRYLINISNYFLKLFFIMGSGFRAIRALAQ